MEAFVPPSANARSLAVRSLAKIETVPVRVHVASSQTGVELRSGLSLESVTVSGLGGPASAGGKRFETAVVWLRSELRLDDNPALNRALEDSNTVIVLYIFSPDTMPSRTAKFVHDSVCDLRRALRTRQSDLVVRSGKTLAVISQLAEELCADAVYFHQGHTTTEMETDRQLMEQLQKTGCFVRTDLSGTLYSDEDMPMALKDLPEDCHAFTEKMKGISVREPIASPDRFPRIPKRLDVGEIPRVETLTGIQPQKLDLRNVPTGGESAALARLSRYIQGKTTKSRENEATNFEFGAFNSYLALGCISPRRIYTEVMANVDQASMRRYCTEFDLQLADFMTFLELKRFQSTAKSTHTPLKA